MIDAMSTWATQYPDAAESLQKLIVSHVNEGPYHGANETDVSNFLRMEASREGGRLFRNNVGAGRLENGSFLRWGLANDSSALNGVLKSADLIGINPIRITADMVDTIVGQFWSHESKRAGWSYTGNEHETAQMRWAQLIVSLGGRATMGTKL